MKKGDFIKIIIAPLLLTAIVLIFCTSINTLQQDHKTLDKTQLEDALACAAVACYAAEGIYPPNLTYLTEHYGIHINEDRYVVKYEVIASNLMPDITVLENNP